MDAYLCFSLFIYAFQYFKVCLYIYTQKGSVKKDDKDKDKEKQNEQA